MSSYRLTKNIAWQIQPTIELVYILNIKTNEFIYFDGVSKDIWLLLANRYHTDYIADKISNDYNVDRSLVYNDIHDFYNQLLKKGVIMQND